MAMQQTESLDLPPTPAPEGQASADDDAQAEKERLRIEQQLAQLERKQAELKRQLAMASHPELADALREVEGRAYGVTRVEEQLAQPLTKSEERQRAKLEKKLAGAREKRDALDAQITELETELSALSDERVAALQDERRAALHQLFTVLAQHSEGFESAGLQVAELIPELDVWLPELRALAGDVADAE
ncbi:MAG: hypothetical protein VYE22_35760 [Myxococcota bacterium]|nr:hypothetical protein [Myxococcota bacterium]